MKTFFPWKSVVLAFETIEKEFLWHEWWGGWCHSCQLLHHSWLFELTRRHSWCKSWHSWHHPPHHSCHKNSFSMVSKAKTTDFQGKKVFITLDFFSPLVMQKLALVTPPPSPLVPQKGLFNCLEGQKDWFSAEKKFFTALIFSLYATNGIIYYYFSS